MKLHRLRLENFRQFRGDQEIEFSTDTSKNVTLVWAANGAGKTTLLNAFTWVLYGQFTRDFEKPEQLYNLEDWATLEQGKRSTVAVELEFENSGQVFTVRRESIYRKSMDGSAEVELSAEASLGFVDETGRHQRSGNPDEHVRQILPERLHSFFFFNGERIEHLVQPSAYEEIEDAIKTILGLKVVERAMRHLPKTAKTFEEILRKHGNEEQRELTEELDNIDEEAIEAEKSQEESRRNVAGLQEEMDLIADKLRGSEKSREQQRERDDLNADDERLTTDLNELDKQLDEVLRDRGFLAPGQDLFERTRSQFEQKREKKELPAPVKRDFIEDLLADGTCICGASLAAGSPGHEHIESWRKRAGLADVEQRWNELHAHAANLMQRRSELRTELQRLLENRDAAVTRRRLVREKISEVSSRLIAGDAEDVRDLENARAALERRKDDEIRRQGRLEVDMERLRERRGQLETKLKKVMSGIAEAELAKRRLSVTREALQTLESIFSIRTEETRSELDAKIKDIYRSITFKPYIPQVNESFQLDLLQSSSGEPVAKSTGENQILSLSFVGALAAIARARYEQTGESGGGAVGARGGIYPIVMDAAFGSLDENYRRDVAVGLPGLAEQIVMLVSKSGGQGAVDHLKDRVGRSYIIHYFTSKADVPSESIEIGEAKYGYVDVSDDGSEYAQITEVR